MCTCKRRQPRIYPCTLFYLPSSGTTLYLSDLKVADSDSALLHALICCLRLKYSPKYFCDGQQTEPQGTPFAINTFFGWSLFVKIQGTCSNVVDVANLTLEQDVLRELMGSRRAYAAVLTVNKKKDLRYLRQRNKPVVEGPPYMGI